MYIVYPIRVNALSNHNLMIISVTKIKGLACHFGGFLVRHLLVWFWYITFWWVFGTSPFGGFWYITFWWVFGTSPFGGFLVHDLLVGFWYITFWWVFGTSPFGGFLVHHLLVGFGTPPFSGFWYITSWWVFGTPPFVFYKLVHDNVV